MNEGVVKSVFLVPLVVLIALILFPGTLMADSCCVRIDGETQGLITEGLTCLIPDDGLDPALSTSFKWAEIFFPLEYDKYTNRSSPKLLGAMFNQEPLDVKFKYYQPNPSTGILEHYYSIELTEARVIGVEGASSELKEKVNLIYKQISWIHEVSSVRYDSCTIKWKVDEGVWTGICASK